MGTLGTCCCDCCLEPQEMPYASVKLIAPLDDCEGGLGDGLGGVGQGIGGVGVGGGGEEIPQYPEASFSPLSCCYMATFELACQQYTEHCGLWASQDLDFSYKAEFYKLRPSYLGTPGQGSCDCDLVQTKLVDYDRTDKIYWVARYRLKTIKIHVGKISVQCDGDESPSCKYYVAASYVFEVCETAFGWTGGVSIYPEFTIDYTCTGDYRPGNCSLTSTYQEASTVNNCTDVLNQDPWQFCESSSIKIISRMKLYDSLPTGQISITNADLPPVSCCGNDTNCVVLGSPCALSLVDNCVPNLPTYNGDPMDYFCQQVVGNNPGPPPYGDGCQITIECPEIQTKASFDATCEEYVLDAQTGCYELVDRSIVNVPGIDQFTCGYCDTEGGRVHYYLDMYGTFSDCGAPALCTTGECCFDEVSPEIQYNCQEFISSGQSQHCRVDISDYQCTVGNVQTHSTGAFCFNLPTVTIELV